MQNRLVGVFDSGIGGLSVARQIKSIVPESRLIYVSDSDYAPYGDKTQEQIFARCLQISKWLKDAGAEVIVVACNTATVNTINQLRKLIDVPFVGVEPGIKPAVKQSLSKRIGVLATKQTASSVWFNQSVERLNVDSDIYVKPCPGLAEQVETLDLSASDLLVGYLEELKTHSIDQIVLGCTHYSFLTPAIEQHIGDNVTVVDTAEAVAKQLQRILNNTEIKVTECQVETVSIADQFYTTGDLTHFEHQLRFLWPQQNVTTQSLLFANRHWLEGDKGKVA